MLNDLFRSEHLLVAVGSMQQILVLDRVRLIDWDIIYTGVVTPNLPTYGTGTAANKPCNFMIAQTVHTIFSYTAACSSMIR